MTFPANYINITLKMSISNPSKTHVYNFKYCFNFHYFFWPVTTIKQFIILKFIWWKHKPGLPVLTNQTNESLHLGFSDVLLQQFAVVV